MGNSIVNESKIRILVGDLRVSKDFSQALNDKVEKIIAEAVARAKGNDRVTVRPVDL